MVVVDVALIVVVVVVVVVAALIVVVVVVVALIVVVVVAVMMSVFGTRLPSFLRQITLSCLSLSLSVSIQSNPLPCCSGIRQPSSFI